MSDPNKDSATPGPTSEFEFSDAQNAVFRELAGVVAVVGLVLMALGIVAILYVGAFMVGARHDPTPLVVAVLGAPMVIVGQWLRSAAVPLEKIATTRGHDVSHLMDAMGEFLRIFTLQRWAYLLAFAVAVLGLVLRVFSHQP